jgi:hypothetical protein
MFDPPSLGRPGLTPLGPRPPLQPAEAAAYRADLNFLIILLAAAAFIFAWAP